MNFNIDKILSEWAYRSDNGQPNVSNPSHIDTLREILYLFGLPHKFIVEYVHGLTEDSIVKNKKSGNQRLYKKAPNTYPTQTPCNFLQCRPISIEWLNLI